MMYGTSKNFLFLRSVFSFFTYFHSALNLPRPRLRKTTLPQCFRHWKHTYKVDLYGRKYRGGVVWRSFLYSPLYFLRTSQNSQTSSALWIYRIHSSSIFGCNWLRKKTYSSILNSYVSDLVHFFQYYIYLISY